MWTMYNLKQWKRLKPGRCKNAKGILRYQVTSLHKPLSPDGPCCWGDESACLVPLMELYSLLTQRNPILWAEFSWRQNFSRSGKHLGTCCHLNMTLKRWKDRQELDQPERASQSRCLLGRVESHLQITFFSLYYVSGFAKCFFAHFLF